MSQTIFNFHDVVLLATTFQSSIFLLLLMFGRSNRKTSDWLLAGFFLAQVFIPFHILIQYGEAFRDVAAGISPNFFFVFEFALWIEGPLLFAYTRSILY